jgi:hypothetical protein
MALSGWRKGISVSEITSASPHYREGQGVIIIVARLEERMSTTPVIGVEVEVIVEIVPRWEIVEPSDAEDATNPTHFERTFIDGEGKSLSQRTISGAGGVSSASFHINEALHRQRRAKMEVPISGSRPPDEVAARCGVRVGYTALR